MRSLVRRLVWATATLAIGLSSQVGCGTDTPVPPSDSGAPVPPGKAGTTSTVELPESTPPLLTKAVADRIRQGMTQGEVLGILLDASRDTPTAKPLVELASTQSKLNPIRYDLTIVQAGRRLVLAFRSEKLAEKTLEGLD